LLLGLPLLAAVGCRQDESISVYTVPHPDREKIRLLAAIVPFNEATIVFKLSGPAEEVAQQKEAFDQFVARLRFDQNERPITWKAPEGWKEERGGSERLVSFRIPGKPREMEVTVTVLGKGASSVPANVERWRGQLHLPPAQSKDEGIVGRTKIDDHEVTLVDLTGLGTYVPPKAAAAMPAGHPPIGAAPRMAPAKRQQQALPFTYDVPKGWEKDARPAGISVESFTVADASGKASVTVTLAGGDLEGTINRWRGQVGLPPLSGDELNRTIRKLPVAGSEAVLVDANNAASTQPNNRILGAILPLQGQTWFFKMTGPSALLERHKAAFEDFVKSVKLGAQQ
jgi:hypothetical protein